MTCIKEEVPAVPAGEPVRGGGDEGGWGATAFG